jgi:hypothetical protein
MANLSTAQFQALKTAILAETDPTFVAYRTQGATGAMASFFNELASPVFYVWRSNYTSEQIATAIDNGITQLDALTASKRDSLLWWADRSHDMTLATAQAAVNDLCGSQNMLKAAVLDGGKRALLRGEKLFSSGTGSLAAPGFTTYEGSISNADVVSALGV